MNSPLSDEGYALRFILVIVTLLQKREFYILGVYTVMSILQGGPGLPIFAKPVYDYISAGQFMGVTVPLAEIPDPTLQFVLQRVCYNS